MPRKKISTKEKKRIKNKVKTEFPNCKFLQEIHYIRYIMEKEWQTMTPEEINNDIKERVKRAKQEMREFNQ